MEAYEVLKEFAVLFRVRKNIFFFGAVVPRLFIRIQETQYVL